MMPNDLIPHAMKGLAAVYQGRFVFHIYASGGLTPPSNVNLIPHDGCKTWTHEQRKNRHNKQTSRKVLVTSPTAATTRLLHKQSTFVFDKLDEGGNVMTQTFEFSKSKSSVQEILNKCRKTASAEDIEALEEEGYGDDEDDGDQAGDSIVNSTGNKSRMKERMRTLWHRYNNGLKLPEDHPIPVKYNISFAHKDQYGKGDGAPALGVVIVDEAHCLRNKRSFAHQFVRLTNRLAFCPVTASPTLNGIKDLRGLASLMRKTVSLDRAMRVPESHTAEHYLLAPEINPFGDTKHSFKDKDSQEHTKKLASLSTPNFTKTEEFQDLKTGWEADKSRRQIHLLLDPFLNLT